MTSKDAHPQRHLAAAFALVGAASTFAAPAVAQQQAPAQPQSNPFDLGEIIVIGERPESFMSVGGATVTRGENWTFERMSLDQAVNVLPGVVSTFDANGRRNESDVFVRGFNRQQVPLLVDGVRIYLPADNRIDFSRFLTTGLAAVQVQKGYASVIDGPGAMGGAINLVTIKPTERFESEGGLWLGGRDRVQGRNGYWLAGSRQDSFYVQGSVTYADRDAWSLSGDYEPPVNSLQATGERLGSDSSDWGVNLKLGFTPNDTDEYVFNVSRQEGEKGAPLNVYNNPPEPPNSYWRWPYWDVQNGSFLTRTQIGGGSYLRTRTYHNTFKNGLDAFDDATYTTQSNPGRFRSSYDDHAYGTAIEVGTEAIAGNTLKLALHYRQDVHTEQQASRPTHQELSFTEPVQTQEQTTWSLALENTFHVTDAIDVVAGISYDDYRVTKAEEFDDDISPNVFEYPLGGVDAFNWQTALIWHYSGSSSVRASVSDRARFPTIFELYSTRFGTATPNPDLGPERATNFEIGWEKATERGIRVGSALFYSDVRDLIQTAVLPDTTTQTQNVGDGRFYGIELSVDAPLSNRLHLGGNYTYIDREITDALQPDLEATGVPTHKAFLYAQWSPVERFSVSPSLEVADDRWSSVNPVVDEAFVATGAYALVNLENRYTFANGLEMSIGARNLLDDDYELAWGFPQPGRTLYAKVRMTF